MGKSKNNSFKDLLGEDELVDTTQPKLSNKQLKKLKREELKKQQDFTGLSQLYNLTEVWLLILEFLPVSDLLINCASLNQFHFNLIHSANCYASILMRDIIEYEIIPKSEIKQMFAVQDYKRILSKIVNKKVKIMKFEKDVGNEQLSQFTMIQVKKSFRTLYKEMSDLMNIIVNGKLRSNLILRYYMEERLDRVELTPSLFPSDQQFETENSHSKTQKDKHTFTYFSAIFQQISMIRISCTSCGLSVMVNSSPWKVFVKPEFKKNRKIKRLFHSEGNSLKVLLYNCNTNLIPEDCVKELPEKDI